MDDALKKCMASDCDGLLTYEYIANHIGQCADEMPALVDNMIRVDLTGQFLVSAARYLAAIDRQAYDDEINRLVAAAIDRDRERRFIADLLPSLWGDDYADRANELSAADNNFRRIYKRIVPSSPI
ncbi:MAG: hypothetical protein NC342_03580 [Pseudoflavonifractor sp.]|nr:hypothetical protein [Alloprevotella sp.]MCM1116596.1 hypothetical protein [Pseudoflavonifractor sp.]